MRSTSHPTCRRSPPGETAACGARWPRAEWTPRASGLNAVAGVTAVCTNDNRPYSASQFCRQLAWRDFCYNPARHMERYDPNGDYVRRDVPELRDVPVEYIREPWRMPGEVPQKTGCVIGEDYPKPIVDHTEARKRALERYALD